MHSSPEPKEYHPAGEVLYPRIQISPMTQEEETAETPNLCTSLREYFASGKTRPLPARKNALASLRNAILRHEDDILRALSADLGRPAFEAYTFEIAPVLREIETLEKNLGK